MNIAILVHKLVRSGTQRQALCLARECMRRGHAVTVYAVSYVPDSSCEELTAGIKIISLSDDSQVMRKKRPFIQRPRALVALVREIRASKRLAQLIDPDTEILNPHANGYITAAFFKRRIKFIPSVWMMNDMPLRSWALWKKSELDPSVSISKLRSSLYTLLDWWKRYYISMQDTIVVLDHMNEEFVRCYLKRPALVVRSGLDLEQFSYVPRTARHEGEKRVLATGIFAPHRRFEDLIEALRILRDKRGYRLHLSIVGDHRTDLGYAQRITSLIKDAGLTSQVAMLGRLSEQDLCTRYHDHDIFVFPNNIQTWGLAVFEAMASGMPVIVSRGAGAHEVLTHGENALLVNAAAPYEIVLALKQLIEDPELYERLSKAGRVFVEKHISWARYGGEMERIFKHYIF